MSDYADEFAAVTSGTSRADYASAFPALRADGWTGTLPLRHGTKFPPPKGYTGWGCPDPSYADCEDWAHEHTPGRSDYRGTTQLGIRVRPDTAFIDVDAYDGKLGAQTLAEAERRWGPLPAGPWSSARDDGVSGIRGYRIPSGTVLASKIAFPDEVGVDEDGSGGIEIVQRHHRYVVAWPSIHPKTGTQYTWRGTAGPSVHPRPEDLPELPAAWIEGLRATADTQAEHRATTAEGLALLQRMPQGECPTVEKALERAVADLRNGSRHDTTCSNVMRLLRLGEQGHPGVVGEHAALARLERAFSAAISDRATPAEARAEFERMVFGANGIGLILGSPTSPLEKGCRCTQPEPRQLSSSVSALAEAPAQVSALAVPAGQTGGLGEDIDEGILFWIEQAAEKLRISRAAKRIVDAEERPPPQEPASISLADLLAEPDEDPVYRINELWPLGGKIVLAAPQKSGKTTTVGNIVKALADGSPLFGPAPGRQGFGGFPVVPMRDTGRIFLADFELDRRMLRRWLGDHAIQRTDRVHVEMFRGKTWDIRDEKIRMQWATYLRELDTEIVIVDPLGPVLFALGINENDNTEVGTFLHALDALVAESGASELLVTHHTGHSGERSRGATVLRGWPDAEWRLMNEETAPGREPAADATRFFAANGRDVALRDTALEYDGPTRHLSLGVGNRATHATEKHSPLVMEIVETMPGMNNSALVEAIQAKAGLERNNARKVVSALLGSGAVHTHKGLKNATLYYPGPRSAGCHE